MHLYLLTLTTTITTYQVLIHWEAVKLFCKGIPTFEHPLGSAVDFGFGITDKRMEGNV